ncbi:MAG: DNA gyrase subunit A [Candidatus Micrarchaeia archaeon]
MDEKRIEETAIEREMQSSYIDYAMSVIVGRALPDARDGLKPAHRRILYAMYMLGNTHDKPTKKSARIVGEVIGKFHPHGDIAAYDTLVRMAQYFSMNHPLVEGQGNMGSIDGDPPAAQRYTEVKLTKIAEEMLEDIDKEAVQMIPNFDNTEMEPVVLPAKFPNLLVNGSSGIAVGMATNILPHNLAEVCNAIVAYVDNKDITANELLNYIRGPDFPTNGIVFMNNELLQSYLTGRGSVTIRGKATIEGSDRKQIIIEEIPYTVNKASLVAKIASLAKDKVINGISSLRDESDKRGIRVVIGLKQDASPELVLNGLYAHTQLQLTMPVMNVAVIGNRLLTLNVKDFIKVFVEHRLEVIKNRTKHDLQVASDRLHIVQGLLKAIGRIEEVTALIKSKKEIKEAREALMQALDISEKQAAAILDMKLSRLTGLESSTLQEEGKDLEKSIERFKSILSDDINVLKIIKEETLAIKEQYGVPRKTAIEEGGNFEEITNEDIIEDVDSVIILTNDGYMKRMPAAAYKLQARGGRGIITINLKEEDFVKKIISCKAKDYLLLLSNAGRAYWLKAYQVPEGTRYASGKAAVNLVKLQEGEKIEEIVNTREFSGKYIVFATRKGRVKRTSAEKFSRPRANGIKAIPLEKGDELANAIISNGRNELLISTKKGKATRFKETDVREMGRIARGVRGIKLSENDEVKSILATKPGDSVLTVTEKGYGKITPIEKYRLQRRGGKGVLNLRVVDKTGDVVKSVNITGIGSAILINSKGISIEIDVASVRVTGRNASGVRLMKLEPGTKLIDVQVTSAAQVETEGGEK